MIEDPPFKKSDFKLACGVFSFTLTRLRCFPRMPANKAYRQLRKGYSFCAYDAYKLACWISEVDYFPEIIIPLFEKEMLIDPFTPTMSFFNFTEKKIPQRESSTITFRRSPT